MKEIIIIVFSVVINALWIIPFVLEVIIFPLKDKIIYERKFCKWNSEHPGLLRKRCVDCKYCKKETLYSGIYPNGYPERHPAFCRLLKQNLSGNREQRCQIAEPTAEFIETHDEVHYPSKGIPVYFSSYGDYYHSTPLCASLKSSQHINETESAPFDRKPCKKCWVIENDKLCPRK